MADILVYEVPGSDMDNLYVQKTELSFRKVKEDFKEMIPDFDGKKINAFFMMYCNNTHSYTDDIIFLLMIISCMLHLFLILLVVIDLCGKGNHILM